MGIEELGKPCGRSVCVCVCVCVLGGWWQEKEVVRTRCGDSNEDASVCQDTESLKTISPELAAPSCYYPTFLFSFTAYSFTKYVLGTCSVPGTAICLQDRTVKTMPIFALKELTLPR